MTLDLTLADWLVGTLALFGSLGLGLFLALRARSSGFRLALSLSQRGGPQEEHIAGKSIAGDPRAAVFRAAA